LVIEISRYHRIGDTIYPTCPNPTNPNRRPPFTVSYIIARGGRTNLAVLVADGEIALGRYNVVISPGSEEITRSTLHDNVVFARIRTIVLERLLTVGDRDSLDITLSLDPDNPHVRIFQPDRNMTHYNSRSGLKIICYSFNKIK